MMTGKNIRGVVILVVGCSVCVLTIAWGVKRMIRFFRPEKAAIAGKMSIGSGQDLRGTGAGTQPVAVHVRPDSLAVQGGEVGAWAAGGWYDRVGRRVRREWLQGSSVLGGVLRVDGDCGSYQAGERTIYGRCLLLERVASGYRALVMSDKAEVGELFIERRRVEWTAEASPSADNSGSGIRSQEPRSSGGGTSLTIPPVDVQTPSPPSKQSDAVRPVWSGGKR